MKKFMFLNIGYKDPSPEMMNDWMKWFASVADRTVDGGNPFGPGREITHDGTKELPVGLDSITGYIMLNAEDMDEAEKIAKTCPIITGIRIYEAKSM